MARRIIWVPIWLLMVKTVFMVPVTRHRAGDRRPAHEQLALLVTTVTAHLHRMLLVSAIFGMPAMPVTTGSVRSTMRGMGINSVAAA
jgi:hypothetical protein